MDDDRENVETAARMAPGTNQADMQGEQMAHPMAPHKQPGL